VEERLFFLGLVKIRIRHSFPQRCATWVWGCLRPITEISQLYVRLLGTKYCVIVIRSIMEKLQGYLSV